MPSPLDRSLSRSTPPQDFSRIDSVLREAVAGGDVPGVVAAVSDRCGVVYEGAAGCAASGTAMRPDTIFRVASMTKLMTSVAIMMLHEEGRLDLDDPLAQHLPGFEQPGVLVSFDEETAAYTVREASRQITLRDMLTHTSGFGYWFLNREVLREANGRVNLFGAPFLMHDPGAKFSYGISTDILGLIVEPVSGLPLDGFMRTRIWRPLGMRATGFELPRESARLASLRRRAGDGFEELP
ncbi:MAG: beta-lactamase family protein, partial [Gammaproteobacteria bacterium]|nr:beta-lactamase family protein [Gammaproteobacteria bacterium]